MKPPLPNNTSFSVGTQISCPKIRSDLFFLLEALVEEFSAASAGFVGVTSGIADAARDGGATKNLRPESSFSSKRDGLTCRGAACSLLKSPAQSDDLSERNLAKGTRLRVVDAWSWVLEDFFASIGTSAADLFNLCMSSSFINSLLGILCDSSTSIGNGMSNKAFMVTEEMSSMSSLIIGITQSLLLILPTPSTLVFKFGVTGRSFPVER
mmetsp:Transcript_7602/g.12927  ORF Transcript_7602/g.12927 Transcript_7602/m.12927 type:complete len:210 (+) Transcript_7602:470-1099(+)